MTISLGLTPAISPPPLAPCSCTVILASAPLACVCDDTWTMTWRTCTTMYLVPVSIRRADPARAVGYGLPCLIGLAQAPTSKHGVDLPSAGQLAAARLLHGAMLCTPAQETFCKLPTLLVNSQGTCVTEITAYMPNQHDRTPHTTAFAYLHVVCT